MKSFAAGLWILMGVAILAIPHTAGSIPCEPQDDCDPYCQQNKSCRLNHFCLAACEYDDGCFRECWYGPHSKVCWKVMQCSPCSLQAYLLECNSQVLHYFDECDCEECPPPACECPNPENPECE